VSFGEICSLIVVMTSKTAPGVRAGGVEGAQGRVRRERDDEFTQIARVDVLEGVVAGSRNSDGAASTKSLDPIGNRSVASGFDDKRWSNERELIAEVLAG